MKAALPGLLMHQIEQTGGYCFNAIIMWNKGNIRRLSLREIFKYGYQETLRLRTAAKHLMEDPVMKIWVEKHQTELDEYTQEMCDRAFVKALSSPRPLWAGWDSIRPDKTKGFGSLEDIEDGLSRLDTIAQEHG